MAKHDADCIEARQSRRARVAAKGERDDGQHEQRGDVDDEHARDARAFDERAGERDDHDEGAGTPRPQATISIPIVADGLEGPGIERRCDPGERDRAQHECGSHGADTVGECERRGTGRGDERCDRDDERRTGEPIRERAPQRRRYESGGGTERRHQPDQPEVETARLVEDGEIRQPGADSAEGGDVAEARRGARADPHGPRS